MICLDELFWIFQTTLFPIIKFIVYLIAMGDFTSVNGRGVCEFVYYDWKIINSFNYYESIICF